MPAPLAPGRRRAPAGQGQLFVLETDPGIEPRAAALLPYSLLVSHSRPLTPAEDAALRRLGDTIVIGTEAQVRRYIEANVPRDPSSAWQWQGVRAYECGAAGASVAYQEHTLWRKRYAVVLPVEVLPAEVLTAPGSGPRRSRA